MPELFDDTDGLLPIPVPAVEQSQAVKATEVSAAGVEARSPVVASDLSKEKSSGGWAVPLLVFTTVLFAFLWAKTLLPGFLPDVVPDDGDVPAGKYVAIFYDDEAKFGKYTQDQIDAIDSSLVRELIESKADFKKIDIDQFDDLGGLDPVYEQMSHEHLPKSPREVPSIVVYADGKKGMEAITDGEQLAKFLKRWLK